MQDEAIGTRRVTIDIDSSESPVHRLAHVRACLVSQEGGGEIEGRAYFLDRLEAQGDLALRLRGKLRARDRGLSVEALAGREVWILKSSGP